MKDIHGKNLKTGDWVLFRPDISQAQVVRAGKISKIENGFAFIFHNYFKLNDKVPWQRQGRELQKLTEGEAMIYILENSSYE